LGKGKYFEKKTANIFRKHLSYSVFCNKALMFSAILAVSFYNQYFNMLIVLHNLCYAVIEFVYISEFLRTLSSSSFCDKLPLEAI